MLSMEGRRRWWGGTICVRFLHDNLMSCAICGALRYCHANVTQLSSSLRKRRPWGVACLWQYHPRWSLYQINFQNNFSRHNQVQTTRKTHYDRMLVGPITSRSNREGAFFLGGGGGVGEVLILYFWVREHDATHKWAGAKPRMRLPGSLSRTTLLNTCTYNKHGAAGNHRQDTPATKIGSSHAWLFQTWLFRDFARKRSFVPFCALLRSFAYLRLRSLVVICTLFKRVFCVLLRPTVFRTTAFGIFREDTGWAVFRNNDLLSCAPKWLSESLVSLLWHRNNTLKDSEPHWLWVYHRARRQWQPKNLTEFDAQSCSLWNGVVLSKKQETIWNHL